MRKRSSLSPYRTIRHFSADSKYFEAIFKKKVIDYINGNNILSDKQYGFCFSSLTTDVQTAIIPTSPTFKAHPHIEVFC